MGRIGFSYVGAAFMLMLIIPNLMWTRKKPSGYTDENENRGLLIFERAGEALTCCCALIFSDFNVNGWSAWSLWLAAAVLAMFMYELWWLRYFRSERKLSNFYSSLLGIPVAGATLPVIGFLLLGIYGRVIWLVIAAVILGIGHIGIHWQHYREISSKFD